MTKWFLIFLVLLMPQEVFSACGGASPNWTAASCGFQDIQDCVDGATAYDTINIPACASGVSWGVRGGCSNDSCRNLVVADHLKIIGAGIDVTVINAANTYATNCYSTPITLSEGARLSALTINDTKDHGSCGTVSAFGGGTRIDHIKIANTVGRSFALYNTGGTGVVDHCQIGNSKGIDVFGETDAWKSTYATGSSNMWFLEDNTFILTTNAIANDLDCQNGGRVVYRYNHFNYSGSFNNSLGGHGCDSVPRGCMIQEVYNNHFDSAIPGSSHQSMAAFMTRSGTGRIFSNEMTVSGTPEGVWLKRYAITNYRSDDDFPNSSECRGPANCEADEGYPCQDQIGRTGGGTGLPPQTSDKMYFWNNGYNVTVYDPAFGGGTFHTDHIQSGTDYVTCTDASCAPVGYVAYTYPHPLVGNILLGVGGGVMTTGTGGTISW